MSSRHYTSGLTDIFGGPFIHILSRLFNMRTPWIDYLPGKTTFTCNLEISPYTAAGTTIFSMNVKYVKKIFWLVNKNITLFTSSHYSPLSGLMYDRFPGSVYYYVEQKDENNDNVNDNQDIHDSSFEKWFGGYNCDILFYDQRFMFVPTASALCYGKGKITLTAAEYGMNFSLPELLENIPFQGVYFKSKASQHIETISGMFIWIGQQLAITIDGPSTPKKGDVYNLIHCPHVVTWSSSNPSILEIDSSTGEVTKVNGVGCVTITATFFADGQYISKSKSVIVGFPGLYIISYFDNDRGYIAEVKCVDNSNLDIFLETGALTYEWGLNYGAHPIEWHTSSEPFFVTGLARSTETSTVYVRLKAENGTRSKTYHHVFTFTGLEYYVTPKHFIVNKHGELYSFDPRSWSQLITAEDLPLKITYSKHSHDEGNLHLPVKVVINDEKTYYWTYLPQPDTSTFMMFPLCDESELLDLLSQMKPNGDIEQMVFWVSAYDRNGVEVHLTPIYLLYRENYNVNSILF